ncbi:MAG: hypothetical protein KOO62_07010 [candidate division Zixibacteria bacterium]|nr:hypothetical protein [candidate division Zixibacteria bacterium]
MTDFRNAVLCLLAVVLIVSSVAADSSYPPPPNIRITNYPQLNNEEQVFLCPTDSNIIIANWRDFRLNYRRVGIGRSTDGGLTWIDSLIPTFMMIWDFDSKQSDPTMTVDRFGGFYMSVLDWDAYGLTGQSTIAFYRSVDKGVSWSGPFSILNHTPIPPIFEDKQFITVDRTGGPHDGNLYCSWTRFPNPDRIVFVRSLDGGSNFSDTVIVGPIQTSTGCGGNQIDAGQFSIPVVGSNGNVHVFWQGFVLDSSAQCTGHMAMKHVVSSDGGQTFTYEQEVVPVSGYFTADGGINTYSQPAADVDIFGGPFDGNIYVSYSNVGPEDGNSCDVDFVRSTDGGLTWSDRMQINDDLNSDEIDNFHPWLIVNDEGIIIVVFHDQRYDAPYYLNFDLNTAYSFDGGETFTSNHRISSVSSSPYSLKQTDIKKPWVIDENGNIVPLRLEPMAGLLGEYIGVTAYHDKINAVWTDSRDGNSEVYTANWYLPILETRLLSPANGSIGNDISDFNWATAWKNDQDRYRVEISPDPTFISGVVHFTVDTNFLHTPSSFGEGTHYWRVRSVKSDESDSTDFSVTWSFEIDLTPPAIPVLISPPHELVDNEAQPTFVWSGPVEAGVEHTLVLSTDPAFTPGPATWSYSAGSDTSFVIPDPLPDGSPVYWKIEVRDISQNMAETAPFTITYIDYVCGNVDGINNSGSPVDIADLTYLVAYLFTGGDAPPLLEAANIDGIIGSGGAIDIADLTYLVAYLFVSGPPPIC